MTGHYRFSDLPEYAFPRLRRLLQDVAPGGPVVPLSIGEPQHEMPAFIADVLHDALPHFARYPKNNGLPELLSAIAGWLHRRYGININPDTQIMALNGTREGLFNAVLALMPEGPATKKPIVLVPNPFYQVYAVGGIAAQADPVFVPATSQTGFLPDYHALPNDVLDRTEIAFICTPSNPQGAVAPTQYLSDLLDLAEKHDFVVFSDECYSEIYRGDPPPGLLQVMDEKGANPNRGLVFHSLSKRSNLPGLRSGFVAGGANLITQVKQLRAYAGAPLPGAIQAVSAAVWSDETHVEASRARYCEKYDIAQSVLGDLPNVQIPNAGFFLWLPVENGEAATLKLWQETGLKTLPGSYLSRKQGETDPGEGYIRVAMVANETTLRDALGLLRQCIYEGS